jgi:hypothetical protein
MWFWGTLYGLLALSAPIVHMKKPGIPNEVSMTMVALVLAVWGMASYLFFYATYFNVNYNGYQVAFLEVDFFAIRGVVYPLLWWLQIYQMLEIGQPQMHTGKGLRVLSGVNIAFILLANGIPAVSLAIYWNSYKNIYAYDRWLNWLDFFLFIESIVYYIWSFVSLLQIKKKHKHGMLHHISHECINQPVLTQLMVVKIAVIATIFCVRVWPFSDFIYAIRLVIESINFNLHIRVAVTRPLPANHQPGILAQIAHGHHGHHQGLGVAPVYTQTPAIQVQVGQQPYGDQGFNPQPYGGQGFAPGPWGQGYGQQPYD